MDAEPSFPGTNSPGSSPSLSSSYLASNDDSRLITNSFSEHALKDDEKGKTRDNENGEGIFETAPQRPFMADPFVSDVPFAGSDGSNGILKDDSLGGGGNDLQEFRREGSMEKPDIESVGNGDTEDKLEMGSIGEADQSVSSMESGAEGRIGMVENNSVEGDVAKLVNSMIAEEGNYKVVEADVPKFSSGEELAVDATPLTGDASCIQTADIKEAEVVPVAGNASLDDGFNQLSHDKVTDGNY